MRFNLKGFVWELPVRSLFLQGLRCGYCREALTKHKVYSMPLELEFAREQELRAKQQDQTAEELQIAQEEQQHLTTESGTDRRLAQSWLWVKSKILKITAGLSKPSCKQCVNWQSRLDGSGYCVCRAAARLKQMSPGYASRCRLYTDEPF